MNKVKKIFIILLIVLFVATVITGAASAYGRGQTPRGLGGSGHSMTPMMGYHGGPPVMSSGMSPISGRWGPEGGNVYGSHPVLK